MIQYIEWTIYINEFDFIFASFTVRFFKILYRILPKRAGVIL